MVENVLPPEVLARMRPEQVGPAVLWSCAGESSESGTIVSASGGFFAKVQMIERAGVVLDTTHRLGPEDIRDSWAAIIDMSRAAPYSRG